MCVYGSKTIYFSHKPERGFSWPKFSPCDFCLCGHLCHKPLVQASLKWAGAVQELHHSRHGKTGERTERVITAWFDSLHSLGIPLRKQPKTGSHSKRTQGFLSNLRSRRWFKESCLFSHGTCGGGVELIMKDETLIDGSNPLITFCDLIQNIATVNQELPSSLTFAVLILSHARWVCKLSGWWVSMISL